MRSVFLLPSHTLYKSLYVIAIGLLGLMCELRAQVDNRYSPEELTKMLDEYRYVYRLEKAYLHTDKPYYVLGETIWFTAYLRDIYSLQASQMSKSLYVDVIDPAGKIMASLNLFMDSTHCHGNVDLGLKDLPGTYRLRAYTSWLRNYGEQFFFEKTIPVYSLGRKTNGSPLETPPISSALPSKQSSQRPDVQFFPEGGNTVLGLESKVGVKLLQPNGRGSAFRAILYDSLDQEVLSFDGNKLGMGSFRYQPAYMSGYYVVLQDHKGTQSSIPYPLPPSLKQGCALAIDQIQDKVAKLSITYSSADLNDGGKLLIVSRHQSIASILLGAKKERHQLRIPIHNVKDGIVRFTVFDHLNRPLAERIIFVYHPPVLMAKLNQSQFKARERVTLDLSLKNSQGLAIPSKASVSVVDNQLVEVDEKPFNIVSDLLIDQEIKGDIESPSWYFWNYDTVKQAALDQLMLTQGWRNFQWMKTLTDFPYNLRYIPESGITISGATRGLRNEEKIEKTQVTMISTQGPFQYGDVITSDSGTFTFTGMVFFDSVSLVFQAYKYNAKRKKATENRNVTLTLFERPPPRVIPAFETAKGLAWIPPEETLGDYVLERKKIEQIKRTFDPLSFVLDTVAITASSTGAFDAAGEVNPNLLYRVNLDSLPGGKVGSVWEYLTLDLETRQILTGFGTSGSGVVIDEDGNQSIEDFNDYLPVWLDGFQLTEQDARSTPISTIGIIEVLLFADVASAQGTENGAIMLYSNSGTVLDLVVRGINVLKHPGFYVAKEFYKPIYLAEQPLSQRPDRRVTLHWEPVVHFNKDGTATISFYTDDKATDYTIQIEGITDDGRPFFKALGFKNIP